MCINNSHWPNKAIIIFSCKYYIVIWDTLVGFFLEILFLLLAVILTELYEKPRRNKFWVTKKVQRRICVRSITFLTAHSSFLCHFLLNSSSFPFPKWYTFWMAPMKLLHNIAMVGILWDVENMKISCNSILAGCYLQEDDIILDFFLASVILAMTLH